MPCVLLVEFVNVDMHPGQCGFLFPFIRGFCRWAKVPVTWVRYGVRAGVQLAQGNAGIGLSDEDSASLERFIQQTGADRVLFSEPVAPWLVQRLESCRASVDFRQLASAWDARFREISGLRAWLGLPVQEGNPKWERSSILCVPPDYSFLPGNAPARKKMPVANIMAGPVCLHRKSIQANPCYRHVAFDNLSKKQGCAFCSIPVSGWRGPEPANAMALAVRQIRAASQTFPRKTGRLQYVVHGANLLARLAPFAEQLAGLDIEPGDFLFACRATDVVRYAAGFESAIQVLAGTGHTLNIHLIGLENFSQQELDRFNKDSTTLDNVRCIQVLQGFEQAYPDTFFFRKHRGMSTILFTPWTTLSDLRFNLAVVRAMGIGDALGKFLTSKLRLERAMPVTALAETDGLLVPAYEDPVFDTGMRTMYTGEIPWRFAHSKVEMVAGIALRMERDDALHGDFIYTELQEFIASRPPGSRDRLRLFSHLLDAVRDAGEIRDLDQALAVFMERVSGAEDQAFAQPDAKDRAQKNARQVQGFRESVMSRSDRELVVALSERGLKPVRKVEGLAEKQVAGIEAGPVGSRFPYRRSRRVRAGSGANRLYELFLSFDRAAVDDALAAAATIEESRDPDAVSRAISRMGRLLGYPDCCADAYAKQPEISRNLDNWLLLHKRLEKPGRVDWTMNPFIPLKALFSSYVPCAMDCEKTMALFREIAGLKLPGAASGDAGARTPMGPWGTARETAEHPVVFMLDENASVILIPEGPVSEDFRYRAGPHLPGSGRIACVLRGNRLVQEPGRLRIYLDDALVDSLDLEAAVWWHQKAFFPEFWRAMAGEALRPAANASPCPGQAPADNSGLPALAPVFAEAVRPVSRIGTRVGEFDVTGTAANGATRLEVILSNGDAEIAFLISPADAVDRYFIKSARFALAYRKETPLDPAAREAVARSLLKLLEPGPCNGAV